MKKIADTVLVTEYTCACYVILSPHNRTYGCKYSWVYIL